MVRLHRFERRVDLSRGRPALSLVVAARCRRGCTTQPGLQRLPRLFTLVAAFLTAATFASSVHAQGIICDSDPSIPCLSNRGGPVLSNVNIVNIFMSADWDGDNSQFGFTQQRIDDFTQKLVSSAYLSAARTDYGIQSASFGGSFDASGLRRVCLTPSIGGVTDAVAIHAWIACLASAGPVPITSSTLGLNATFGNIPPPDDNTLYVIYVPQGTNIVESNIGVAQIGFVDSASCDHFNGYHFWHDVPKWEWSLGLACPPYVGKYCSPFCCTPFWGPQVTTQRFAYAVVPVNCSKGDFDSLTKAASHEIVEAATDPIDFTAWTKTDLSSVDGEVADLCKDRPDNQFRMSDGNLVATYWSMSKAACFPQDPALGPARVLHAGFAWSQDTTGAFDASSLFAFNSDRGTVKISNLDVGRYEVRFGQMATAGGNVQVTAYGSGARRCKVESWDPSGADERVLVRCFTPDGSPVNTNFTVSFQARTGLLGSFGGYVWADQPSTASYAPNSDYQWNSAGGAITAQRSSTGSYNVSFPNQNISGGTVEVTAYGTGSEYCKVVDWGSFSVDVACFDASGAPVDAQFSLVFAAGIPNGTGSAYYAWADQPSASSYTPFTTYQQGILGGVGTIGTPATITRSDTGSYSVTFPQMGSGIASSNVQITAYGSGSEYCDSAGWSDNNSDGSASASVACFSASGAPVDTTFAITYSNTSFIIP